MVIDFNPIWRAEAAPAFGRRFRLKRPQAFGSGYTALSQPLPQHLVMHSYEKLET